MPWRISTLDVLERDGRWSLQRYGWNVILDQIPDGCINGFQNMRACALHDHSRILVFGLFRRCGGECRFGRRLQVLRLGVFRRGAGMCVFEWLSRLSIIQCRVARMGSSSSMPVLRVRFCWVDGVFVSSTCGLFAHVGRNDGCVSCHGGWCVHEHRVVDWSNGRRSGVLATRRERTE